jgi:hypothetical protein
MLNYIQVELGVKHCWGVQLLAASFARFFESMQLETYASLIMRKERSMPRTKASAKARRACEADARSMECASREATPEFEEDGSHLIYMLLLFCDVQASFSLLLLYCKSGRSLEASKAYMQLHPTLYFVSSCLTVNNIVLKHNPISQTLASMLCRGRSF